MDMSKLWKSEDDQKQELAEHQMEIEKAEKQEKAKTILFEKIASDYILNENLSDEEKELFLNIFDSWKEGIHYKVGDKFLYNDVAYEVIQEHTSQADWLPSKLPALYKVFYQKETSGGDEVIHDFKPPSSTEFYKLGDKVRFEGDIYESLLAVNTYSPKEHPAGWLKL